MATYFPYNELYAQFYLKPESYFLDNFKGIAEQMANDFFQANGIEATASLDTYKGEDGYMRFVPNNVATAMLFMGMPAEEFANYDPEADKYTSEAFSLEKDTDGSIIKVQKIEFALAEKLVEG